ncbi:MAG: hypothetical protein ACSHYF_18090 [Verrucomicrobiaceae bacterium]
MSDQPTPEERWQHVSSSLRQSLDHPAEPPEQAPPGFATRIVARSKDTPRAGFGNWSKPYLTGAALLTLLGAGFGAGRLVQPDPPAAISRPVPADHIADEIRESLRQTLNLTPAQQDAIAPDIASFNTDVIDNRRTALVQYYESLLNLHDQIENKLDPDQQKVLQENRALLVQEIRTRFPDHPVQP